MKNFLKILLLIYVFFIINFEKILAKSPELVCNWLPWCKSNSIWSTQISSSWTWFFWYIWNIISLLIEYVAVISVFVLIFAWIKYILSIWKDDEAVKARKMIVWSLVWVLITNAAWFLVNLVNNFNFN